MKWDDFKNRFKKDVHQQNVEVDVDSIWNAIESDVDAINNKNKNRFFFWIFFLGIGLASGIGFYVLSNDNTSIVVEKNKSLKENVELEKSNESIGNQYVKDIENGNNKNSVVSIEERQNSNIDLNDFKINNKSTNNSISEKANKSSITEAVNTNSNINREKTITRKSDFYQSPKIENNVSVEGNKIDLSNVSKVQTTTIETFKQNIQLKPSTLSSLFLLLKNSDSESFTFDIPQRNASSLYLKELEEEWKRQTKKYSGDSRFNFSTEFFGGVNFVNRKIEAKDATSNNLLSIRKDNEYPMEAIQFGLLLKAKTKKGIYFSGGIQRTAIAERYEYDNTLISMDSIMGVKTLLVNLTGDTIPRMGMVPRTTTLDLEKKIFNTYQLLDIPVFIGYEKMKGDWQFGVEAGILANISLKTEGIIPNELFDDIDIKTGQDEVFKSNVGLSYHLGLTASRKIQGNWWLTFAPTLRILPSDFTTDTYGLSQKYTLFGARVGVRYNFE